MNNNFIKKNRAHSVIRKFAWIYTLLIISVGFWFPKIGLTVILIMLGLIFTSIFYGKYWCGNFCAHGSLFDVLIMPLSRNKKFPKIMQSKITVAIIFSFFIINFSLRIYNITEFWASSNFLDKLGFIFVMIYFVVTIIGSILGILITPRAWCTVCPMGTMQTLIHSFSSKSGLNKKTNPVLTLKEKSCINCKLCTKVCPMQLEPHKSFSIGEDFTHSECIKCSTCIKNCPKKIIKYDK